MGYFPRTRLSLIDIRHAIPPRDLVPAQLELSILNAHFVGKVSNDADELVFQLNLPVRGRLGYLFPFFPDFVPSNLSATDRMHRGDGRTV